MPSVASRKSPRIWYRSRPPTASRARAHRSILRSIIGLKVSSSSQRVTVNSEGSRRSTARSQTAAASEPTPAPASRSRSPPGPSGTIAAMNRQMLAGVKTWPRALRCSAVARPS